ncbi:MAG: hypothetical protein KDA24_24860 [Deltaproteobacteria bacterium]|nr:hypothetical protein [Deltaproteobacteria bacterium]
MKRLMLAVTLFLGVLFAGPVSMDSEGVTFVSEAHAAAEAKVSVAVIKATKSGSIDDKSAKYESVISQVGGYSGFTYVSDLGFKAGLGKTVTKEIAGRKLQVTVKSMAADKVTTAVTVIDPNGKKHAVSSSTKPGASIVVAARSSDGKSAHLFIVTVKY